VAEDDEEEEEEGNRKGSMKKAIRRRGGRRGSFNSRMPYFGQSKTDNHLHFKTKYVDFYPPFHAHHNIREKDDCRKAVYM
jgi:hypothetical protein